MAFGFIQKVKKVFSFGKNKVEEVPEEGVAPEAQEALPDAEVIARAEAEKLATEEAARKEAERVAAEKVEAERVAAEKAEADRIAVEKAEAERVAAEKVEADRIAAEAAAKAEADRIAAEKQAADDAAKAESERIAAEKAAQKKAEHAAAQAEAEKQAAERAAADAAAKQEAEEKAAREAAEKAEAEQLAAQKAKAERAAAEAAAREEEKRQAAEKMAAEKAEAERKAAEEEERAEALRLEEEAARAEQEAARAAEAKDEFAPDGVVQPTPETAPEDIAPEDTPEPEADTPEPPPAPAPDKPVGGKVQVSAGVSKVEAPAEPEPEPEKKGWFQRLKTGLSRSSKELSDNIKGVFTKRKLDEDTLQDLEDVLIQADLGLETAIRVTDALSDGRYGKDISDEEVRSVMAGEIVKVLDPVAMPLELDLSHKPHVILVVGVNGTGKTTTIGKLGAKLHEGGLSVTLAAGDTFRAAAIEQLKIWGERIGANVVSSKLGADAAGLAYDAFEKAKEAGSDVLIIDTAGRLQNKAELMDELAKIVRVLGKLDPEAPHTVLQTLDATTGQNALSQVEIFRNVAGVNGLVMTKLDGTARGGILVAIAAKHKLPVYFVGVGEQVDDLEPFSAREFASAITGITQ